MNMKDLYILALFFLGTAGVVAVFIVPIILLAGLWQRLLVKNYKLLASRLGWVDDLPPFKWNPFCSYAPPSIKGVYRDRNVHVYHYVEGSGKHAKSYTVFTMNVMGAGAFGFDIEKEGLLEQFSESGRQKDIHTGEEDFDRTFTVNSNDDFLMRRVLTPQIMSRMMELNDRYKGFNVTLQHGRMRYKRSIQIISEVYVNEFKEVIDFFADLADQIMIADKIEMVWDDEVIESGSYRHVEPLRPGLLAYMKLGIIFFLILIVPVAMYFYYFHIDKGVKNGPMGNKPAVHTSKPLPSTVKKVAHSVKAQSNTRKMAVPSGQAGSDAGEIPEQSLQARSENREMAALTMDVSVRADETDAHIKNGIKLLKTNDLQGALSEFKQACDLGDQNGCAWYERYKNYNENGPPAPAVTERNPGRERELLEDLAGYQEALRLNPQDTKAERQVYIAHGFLAELYFNQNQYNEALTHLNASIEWNGEDMGALHNRGIILNKMGDKEAALMDWKRACELGYIDSCMMYNKTSGSGLND